MATGMHCEGRIPAHGADSAAGAAYLLGRTEKNTLLLYRPTVSQSISLKTSARRRLLWSFVRLQCEPVSLLGSREEYPNKCPFVSTPASQSVPLWTHCLKKKINPFIYIYKKCRYFYIFCMVLLKKKFLCIFYIYTDLLNLIIGNQLKEVLIFFIWTLHNFTWIWHLIK